MHGVGGEGGGIPTLETPAHSIESHASEAHDEDMETLTRIAADHLLDPVVITATVTATVALLSGSVARIVEIAQGERGLRDRRHRIG